MTAKVPNRMVFIWYGAELTYLHYLAIASAIARCRPEAVSLLVEGWDRRLGEGEAIAAMPGVTVEEDLAGLLEAVPRLGPRLVDLGRKLTQPAARANLLRLADLAVRGGVYLDFDTITVRDLGPLCRRYEGFIGREHLALPAQESPFLRPLERPVRWVRRRLRRHCARHPSGVRRFDAIAWMYVQAVNNAVIGAAPGNRRILDALEAALAVPEGEVTVRFRLGTHLMQRLTGNRSHRDLEVLPPAAFYPLGPVLSRHWFVSGSAAHLEEYVRPDTYVVHWYHSNLGEVAQLDRDWARREAGSVAFARLACDAEAAYEAAIRRRDASSP